MIDALLPVRCTREAFVYFCCGLHMHAYAYAYAFNIFEYMLVHLMLLAVSVLRSASTNACCFQRR